MKTDTSVIRFDAQLISLKDQTILRLPESISEKLPSRGQVCVIGVVNAREFRTVLEPDGYWGHWMRLDDQLQMQLGSKPGDTVTIEMEVTKEWPEPTIPTDFSRALNAATDIHTLWATITPMARWEWIRWVNATNNPDTRKRRVEASISKMRSGKRRPCCFNLAACTDPDLSKSGRLLTIV